MNTLFICLDEIDFQHTESFRLRISNYSTSWCFDDEHEWPTMNNGNAVTFAFYMFGFLFFTSVLGFPTTITIAVSSCFLFPVSLIQFCYLSPFSSFFSPPHLVPPRS